MNAILGEKLGMTQIFDAQSRAIPVTVIKAGPCQVVQVKQPDSDGYSAIQLAFGDIKAKQVNKPMNGHYAKAGVEPARYLVEIRVDDPSAYKVGQKILLGDVLAKGGMADVSGLSKGKGTQGVMRRHNFQGQGAAHGNHKKHRAPGSIGACSTPARVFKGMRMGWSDGWRSGHHPQPADRRGRHRSQSLAASRRRPGCQRQHGADPRGGEVLMAPISRTLGPRKLLVKRARL